MDSLGVWKTIKIGFWLGVGFILPQIAVLYSGTIMTMFAMPSMMEETFEENFLSEIDKSKQINVLEYREKMNGKRLLILGSVKNEGSENASSIQLEAELLDSDGRFVFECSKYINKKLKPGETENFQINCGCGDTIAPEHSSVNVRVVSASSY
ncbi:MAG: FxLYD domain-containing protein [Candidatus Thiodiazotropha sp. (ex Monitilora ramsayi)]|nr:FxLYD domain-containing protein [Candidatus Thiodiazotropha sp. (ex Monitilora ramsayi)]